MSWLHSLGSWKSLFSHSSVPSLSSPSPKLLSLHLSQSVSSIPLLLLLTNCPFVCHLWYPSFCVTSSFFPFLPFCPQRLALLSSPPCSPKVILFCMTFLSFSVPSFVSKSGRFLLCFLQISTWKWDHRDFFSLIFIPILDTVGSSGKREKHRWRKMWWVPAVLEWKGYNSVDRSCVGLEHAQCRDHLWRIELPNSCLYWVIELSGCM